MDKLIVSYTIDQATEDGILVDIRKIHVNWQKGTFSHVTANLLSKGYIDEDTGQVNLSNLVDLLNQSVVILRRTLEKDSEIDPFYSGTVELPSGEKQDVFIRLNELHMYTIMLPEDD